MRNYRAPCPVGWDLESHETGVCRAPDNYDGRCDPRTSFSGYSSDMKNAWEHACKVGTLLNLSEERSRLPQAYFPVSALEAASKLTELLQLRTAPPIKGTGPIGASGTKYSGAVLEANGTIYLPSRRYQSAYQEEIQPKTPDTSAAEAKLLEEYIARLVKIKAETTDSRLQTAIQAKNSNMPRPKGRKGNHEQSAVTLVQGIDAYKRAS
ncbi:Pb-fam-5 protein [Besnoitia besnoiti]|uniref:Pb-fam-5 protein n=1 Tax=Besnoitia besnoiti TaxID=94643 RepID=A0A2A9MP34_BESBE|nr:Pb-fam-5 protein [Besnoitia besnoiti]PFH37747.1 Pb-fam-5 protein [Besnoitia besnoiti]